MVKPKRPIAEHVLARIELMPRGRARELRELVAGRAAAQELLRTLASRDKIHGMHPGHAAYACAHNHLALLCEQLTELEEMDPIVKPIADAEDLYLPSGPPLSPLTRSYFQTWAFYDAYAGRHGETIGTVIIALGREFGMHPALLRLIEALQESRMGVHFHEGCEGDLVNLRELVTGTPYRALVPSGHRGIPGELWYARVLPPAMPGAEHLVFTTPYLLLHPGVDEWRAYFRRHLPEAPREAQAMAHARHMKLGPARDYWTEFVFESYANYRTEAVLLIGLPDRPESRPLSKVNDPT